MEEQFVKLISSENEFFDEFHDVGAKASEFMGKDWTPNFYHSEKEKESLSYLLTTNQLYDLVFRSAAIYKEGKKFSSVQIHLSSSFRAVTIRVKKSGDELIAEKIVDKSNNHN